ncbi:hypothetical protein NPIL_215771 [Nephila pilipes]|uniref:Uncharacterized protein n=1 Tax=Nephila pilipes TaxID=299642 RepID=A0A8X6NEB2_NEPPI|nr:hypothetical protein NPIL_215771 [Nephila pilipes]
MTLRAVAPIERKKSKDRRGRETTLKSNTFWGSQITMMTICQKRHQSIFFWKVLDIHRLQGASVVGRRVKVWDRKVVEF